ncbi:hypothetical protein Aazo_2828 ['Nostoc azollae' 0708]|mgnify:CR=1 FL=1|jgi:hypothetical protein|uniref:Uncharacterized protein n=1 Tax=Nostoc azollae (strain 0708) TaxID=551115 RepID=D7E0L8_NOSA0|nr:hypothetical protein Aazo_2828 ['Nostoc azollae' 0708]
MIGIEVKNKLDIMNKGEDLKYFMDCSRYSRTNLASF